MSDAEIAKILQEPKEVCRGQLTRLANIAKGKSKYHRGRAKVACKSGRKLRLRVSLNPKKPNRKGFSIILSYPSRGKEINLIRCNGYQGAHTNHLEKQTIPRNTFHVHELTDAINFWAGLRNMQRRPTNTILRSQH